jgi:hypothetical protein
VLTCLAIVTRSSGSIGSSHSSQVLRSSFVMRASVGTSSDGAGKGRETASRHLAARGLRRSRSAVTQPGERPYTLGAEEATMPKSLRCRLGKHEWRLRRGRLGESEEEQNYYWCRVCEKIRHTPPIHTGGAAAPIPPIGGGP